MADEAAPFVQFAVDGDGIYALDASGVLWKLTGEFNGKRDSDGAPLTDRFWRPLPTERRA